MTWTKLITGVVVTFFILGSANAQQKPTPAYLFSIDLNKTTDDKLKVELSVPPISASSITYHLPKIVPGTYSEDDFGRYVEDFKAFDAKGSELKVTHANVNSWTISDANKLSKLTYWVNDSYDDATTKQVIFEPAGSNIQKDTNFVINNHAFLGYFDDMKKMPYELTVMHAPNFYGSTALTDKDKSTTRDLYEGESYNKMVDNPIMFGVPDTTTILVGKTQVLISVYSPNKKIHSAFLASKLATLLQAQGKYLGGDLPVDKYAFLIYTDDKYGYSGGEGALEHSYCSMYYYPERDEKQLADEFVDHAAHEFFHIITPLTIHSEEIQNFDFNDPKMSRHLWLYEGSTEYHAQMVQEKYGLISKEDLLKRLSQKITLSRKNYNDTVPFTVMSSGVLGRYKPQFGNVYQKGALINMCLDIELLRLSGGKYGIMNLISDLSRQYGKQKGFKDDELFAVIEKLTYPEIGQFLKTYVSGDQPLPLEKIFSEVGIKYQTELESTDSAFSMGKVSLKGDGATHSIVISDTTGMNEVGHMLGYYPGDRLVSMNGMEVNFQKFQPVLNSIYSSAKAGDSLVVKVIRKDETGKENTIDLHANMRKYPVMKSNVLSYMDNADATQLALQKEWLKARS